MKSCLCSQDDDDLYYNISVSPAVCDVSLSVCVSVVTVVMFSCVALEFLCSCVLNLSRAAVVLFFVDL